MGVANGGIPSVVDKVDRGKLRVGHSESVIPRGYVWRMSQIAASAFEKVNGGSNSARVVPVL